MRHKWIIKALVQKSISLLPCKHRLNFFFQKHITKGVELTNDYFNDRLVHARNHLKYYTELTGKAIPSTTLELGTGWYPVIPVYFYLRGVNSIYTIDIVDHIRNSFTRRTIVKFVHELDNNSLKNEAERFIPERVDMLRSLAKVTHSSDYELLNKMGIVVRINDARCKVFGDDFFDLIHSNNTFEHIYPDELKQIIEEFTRVLKKEGAMSHFIDMTDHFAHFDSSISIYNFLKFSESQWKIIDNSIQPQNRLRIKDYKLLYKQLGIEFDIREIRNGNKLILQQTRVNELFSDYTPDELAVSHSHFISRGKKIP